MPLQPLQEDTGLQKVIKFFAEELLKFMSEKQSKKCLVLIVPHNGTEEICCIKQDGIISFMSESDAKKLFLEILDIAESLIPYSIEKIKKKVNDNLGLYDWINRSSGLIKLNDEIYSFEKDTGRNYSMFVVSESSATMDIIVRQNGKPILPEHSIDVSLKELFEEVVVERKLTQE